MGIEIMIVDKIERIELYAALLPGIRKGMAAVVALGDESACGRYEFEGGYFMVQKGETIPLERGTFEAHRKYIDVQIMLEGSEYVAWGDIRDLRVEIPYDEDIDVERFSGSFEHVIKISKSMFYVAFPHDAHKPVSHTDVPSSYTKIVMKLPVPA